MLQQPSRDEWPGQRGTRRPAKRCQGHCLCRVCGVAHEACELRRSNRWNDRCELDGPARARTDPGRREIKKNLSYI